MFTGIPTHDATNALKMYRREIIAKLAIKSKGFEVFLEIPLKLHSQGCRILPGEPGVKARQNSLPGVPCFLTYSGWLNRGFFRRFARLK